MCTLWPGLYGDATPWLRLPQRGFTALILLVGFGTENMLARYEAAKNSNNYIDLLCECKPRHIRALCGEKQM